MQRRLWSNLVAGVLAIIGLAPAPSAAQATSDRTVAADAPGLLPGRPSVQPIRVAEPPRLDGRLDDAAWQNAPQLTTFVQQRPFDGEPATENTVVWVAYDDDHLYFAFHLKYDDPSIMRANRVDRDQAATDDLVTVYLDTFFDQQRAYDFDLNAYNVQGDGLLSIGFDNGPIPRADRSWNTLFHSGAQIVDDGYTAEMAIPFKSLRYAPRAPGESHRWGLQIVREIKGKNEENDVWAPMSRDQASFYSQMGLLEGMTNLSTSRNLEFLPTFTTVQFGTLDEDTDAFVNNDVDPDAGVNIKYGVTSNLTADFALNPDFSQIESDRPQIEANQRFPLFYPELRPFFLEGAGIFAVRGPVTFVHTRTIVDPLYGAKLTGKVGNVSVGVLYANDEAPGRVDDPLDPAFDTTARTFVGRVMYDLYAESHVGALVTNREHLDGYSRLALVDGSFRLGSTHTLGYRFGGTTRRENDEDAEGGHIYDMDVRKTGRNLSYFAATFGVSPDFSTDAGFVRRRDQRRTFGNVAYQWWPQNLLISWGPQFDYGRTYDYDGVLQDENARLRVDTRFSRNINANASVSRDLERFGGIDFWKTRFAMGGGVNTSRSYQVGFGFDTGDQIFFDEDAPYLGRESGFNVNVTLRPVPSLQSRLSFDRSRFVDVARGEAEVFDARVFRAQTTYQVTSRMNVRNITQYDTFDETLDLNLLGTYRVNAGTVFFLGYDDHYQQFDDLENDRDGDGVPDVPTSRRRQTNRAFFLKLQYLFRY